MMSPASGATNNEKMTVAAIDDVFYGTTFSFATCIAAVELMAWKVEPTGSPSSRNVHNQAPEGGVSYFVSAGTASSISKKISEIRTIEPFVQ